MTKIIEDIIGKERIEFNFKDINNFIEIDGEVFEPDELPLSNGEKRLLCFIFNLFIIIAENSNNSTNKIVIIDDPIDFFDSQNYLNIYYLIKMANFDYKIKFLILTHNDHIITSFHNNDIKINLQIMYINEENERLLKTVQEQETEFLSFANGIKQIKQEILKAKENKNDQTIYLIYFMWILRVKEYIFDFELEEKKDKIFEFTKYPFLTEVSNKDIFDNAISLLKEEFKIELNIDFSSYKKIVTQFTKDKNAIKFSNFDDFFIIKKII